MMKTRNYVRCLCALLLCVSLAASGRSPRRHALIVGISQYSDPQWERISGANDVDLLERALRHAGWHDVVCLRDEEASYERITSEVERLARRAQRGDTLYLHFSGHGQPVYDMDGDEGDSWDESFVPYDAPQTYVSKYGATGRHLLDDELFTMWKRRLCPRVGEGGLVVITIDACFSGGSSRGEQQMFAVSRPTHTTTGEPIDTADVYDVFPDIDAPQRGWAVPYVSPDNAKPFTPRRDQRDEREWPASRGEGRMLMMESCASYQKSREIHCRDGKYYGPLSYAMARSLVRYRGFHHMTDFRAYVLGLMQHYSPQQQLVTERNSR